MIIKTLKKKEPFEKPNNIMLFGFSYVRDKIY